MDSMTSSQRCCIKKLREDCVVEDLTLDPAKTIAAVDKRYSLSSSRVALTALRKMYPECKAFIDEMKARCKTYKAIDKTQAPTEKQAAAHIDWDTIVAWRDVSGADLPVKDRLLVGLYTYIEPQRADYTPMRIVARLPKTLEDGINYLVMAKKSARFLFHAYKTAAVHGDRTFHIPAPLYKIICEYLGERRTGYLFQDASIAWSEARLGAAVRSVFQRYFNKDFGINSLRHSFVTKINEGMPSLAYLEDAATKMGHSVITHQTYRHIPLEKSS
jgi:hypothetical protein